MKLPIIALALALAAAPAIAAPEFYVMDNGVGRGSWTPDQQAKTLKELGYDGISYNYTKPEDLAAWQKAFKEQGLKIYGIYAHTALEPAKPYDPRLPEAIKMLKGTGTVLWLTVQATKAPGDHDDQAVKTLQELADLAAANDVRCALYGHAGFYMATSADTARMAAKVQRPNLAATVNLCHEFLSGHGADLDKALKEVAPLATMATINGIDVANKKYLLRLDQGDFDLPAYLKKLAAAGYGGPIGLQCFSVPGDVKENLAVNIATWRRIAGQPEKRAEPINLAAGQWTEQRATEWYASQPWLVGFNFVPSTAVNDTELWQDETFDPATIDRELAWAEQLGYNSCRVFVQYIVWKAAPAGLKQRFTRFLEIAAQHHLRVMPVLFDDCAFDANRDPYLGKQDDPVPGTSNARWVPSPGLKRVTDKAAWPDLEQYVKDIVGTFKNDQRIVLWDLYNEPGNSGMGNQSLPLVEASFAWARQANPSQPLTIGVWGAPKEISDRQLELSDIVSFHFYGDNNGMKARIADFKTHRRPVICTEWMARTLGAKYETELPLFKAEQVGCYNWGLVNGRTQCQYPWGSPKDAPEPKVWFHDLLRQDGSPKDAAEVAFVRKFTGAPGVPQLKPLFDFPVRDTCVCVGPDAYYLIGTTGAPSWWATNEGIRIWQSKDLKSWEPMGLVWSFAKDMTWQQKKGEQQAIWAPEMHYFNGTFWICYCVNYGGTGILKSTSGKPEGPYVDIKKDGPLTGEIDASLFQDDDGKVYFVYQNGKIARLKDDMSGLAEEPKLLKSTGAQVGFEGAFLFKANGLYQLSCADFTDGRYHCYVASSKNLMGPYGERRLAIPHGGHNMFFKDRKGNWWSTFFGNDGDAPFKERAGLLPVAFGLDGLPMPVPQRP